MSRDGVARWAFIAGTGAVAAAGLWAHGITLAGESLTTKLPLAALLLFFGTVFTMGSRVAPRFSVPLDTVSDLCLSVLQIFAVTVVFPPLTYLAAIQGFPLLDAELSRLDAALFGFDWDAAASWVAARPWVDQALMWAYSSVPYQIGCVLLTGSITRPGTRAGELVWQAYIAISLTCVIFTFTPALGKGGHIGTEQIEMLLQTQRGEWTVLDYGHLPGIINFPSFHAALGVLLTYAVRRHRWALAVSLPLNLLLIAATPTVGGHYLVDVPAGVAVAAVAIAVTRLVQQRLAVPFA